MGASATGKGILFDRAISFMAFLPFIPTAQRGFAHFHIFENVPVDCVLRATSATPQPGAPSLRSTNSTRASGTAAATGCGSLATGDAPVVKHHRSSSHGTDRTGDID